MARVILVAGMDWRVWFSQICDRQPSGLTMVATANLRLSTLEISVKMSNYGRDP